MSRYPCSYPPAPPSHLRDDEATLSSDNSQRSEPDCDELARLIALCRTGLLDSPPEEAFDRFTRLAARVLNVPVSLISLVDEDRQFFKSEHGLDGALKKARQTSLEWSFCQHVVSRREPLVINDARKHELVRDNPAVREFGVIAYLGVPLETPDSQPIGALCVIDHKPRRWTDAEIQTLKDLCEFARTEIALRWQLTNQEAAATALLETNRRLEAEIVQREQAEQHLLRAQRLESIGTLASGLAHDLNNMLSPILMSAQLLHHDWPDATREELISTIENSAERASGIVKQVLAFARGVEGERLPIQPKLLIREIEQIVTETFPRQITFQHRIAANLHCVEADPTQLHQVLMNLCVNARDAMALRGGTLRLEADNFQADKQYAATAPGVSVGDYVRLRVADTGVGIAPDLQEKIFDPFFSTKPIGSGTGLGLSTVAGIVKSHGGFVRMSSEPGKGATFDVFIPAMTEPAPDQTKTQPARPAFGNGELILVVDDEPGIRAVTEAVLTRNGYRVLTAEDGTDALAIYGRKKDEIAVVIADVVMPIVDGVSLCRSLKRINPDVKIIVASGWLDEGKAEVLRTLDVAHMLTKPFNTPTLIQIVAETLASAGPAPTAE